MITFKKALATALLALTTAVAFAGVDINKANQAELEGIKGIGPAMSTRILDARKAGPFKDWADLHSRVKGIGDARAARLSADGLTVNGAEFKASEEMKAKAPKGRGGKAHKEGKEHGEAKHKANEKNAAKDSDASAEAPKGRASPSKMTPEPSM